MVFAKFVEIPIWKFPLIFLGLLLAISLPSMVIAWLKLRQRNLGPILEGNGWAVNGRVKINIPFGTALTDMAVLPPGAKRSLEDPYEDKEAAAQQRKAITFVVLVVLAAAAIWVRWDQTKYGRYFWQPAPASAAAAITTASPAAPAFPIPAAPAPTAPAK
jgi:hypothetical protein